MDSFIDFIFYVLIIVLGGGCISGSVAAFKRQHYLHFGENLMTTVWILLQMIRMAFEL